VIDPIQVWTIATVLISYSRTEEGEVEYLKIPITVELDDDEEKRKVCVCVCLLDIEKEEIIVYVCNVYIIGRVEIYRNAYD
jgi:hypothetical protein